MDNIFAIKRINEVLFQTMGQAHVHIDFIEELGLFLSKQDLYTFGSVSFNANLNDFFESNENNKDNLCEFVTSYYANLILNGVALSDFAKLSNEVRKITDSLPFASHISHLLGPSEFKRLEHENEIDLFSCVLYLIKIQYTSLLEYSTRNKTKG